MSKAGYRPIMITIPPEMFEAIENLRFDRRMSSNADAYRMLLQKGLEAIKAEPPCQHKE